MQFPDPDVEFPDFNMRFHDFTVVVRARSRVARQRRDSHAPHMTRLIEGPASTRRAASRLTHWRGSAEPPSTPLNDRHASGERPTTCPAHSRRLSFVASAPRCVVTTNFETQIVPLVLPVTACACDALSRRTRSSTLRYFLTCRTLSRSLNHDCSTWGIPRLRKNARDEVSY